ncbi:MAG: sensor histidine kinase N-terminal domain-containing protein [Deltaproteobacteria bacterium]|nr:sensor histidine kinase N-terminal domain-containing protein [Deltaproteobacteria bacterium]
MFTSIKFRLIVWFLSAFSIVLAGLGLFLYYELEKIAIGSVDRHLHSEVQFLASFLREEEQHGHIGGELIELSSAATGEYALPLSGHYYQVLSQDGKIIARSPSLPVTGATLPFEGETLEPSYKIITGPENEPLRMLTQTFKLSTGTITIQAADTLKEAYHVLGSFSNILLIIFPIVFALSGIGIFIITNRALKALNIFSGNIGQITEKNLNKRIELRGIETELKPLADSFNIMMGRIEDAFTKQGQFLSDASHELRTPTSIIKSYCDVTLKKTRSEVEYKEALTVIKDTSEKMTSLIQKILDVARLEAKDVLIKREVVDIGSILSNVYKLMLPIAEENDIEILLEDGKKVDASGDKDRLAELFINLVDNAIKYNRKGGRVVISSDTNNACAVITISDTGIGIPEKDMDKIFDRFYRVDKSRGEVAGTGLGLSIAKSIVEAHRGTIEVKKGLGAGTEFKVILPVFSLKN